MSSLKLLGDYGSSDEDSNAGDTAMSIAAVEETSKDAPTISTGSTKLSLPTATDMFSEGFVPQATCIAVAKRSIKEAFENDALREDNSRNSYRKLETQPISEGNFAAPFVFKPPQLKRPNTVTEESKLWNSKLQNKHLK